MGEINNQPSKTVPNQAMTVRELIIRFASGLPLDAGKVPIFEGDTDLPDIEKMDLIEQHAYYDQLMADRKAVEDRVTNARKKQEEMKMEKVVSERVQQRIKEAEDKVLEKWREQNIPSPKNNL